MLPAMCRILSGNSWRFSPSSKRTNGSSSYRRITNCHGVGFSFANPMGERNVIIVGGTEYGHPGCTSNTTRIAIARVGRERAIMSPSGFAFQKFSSLDSLPQESS